MTVFVFVLACLATWRLTHLVVEDQLPLVKKPREWIIARKPHGNLAYLLGCTYCSSVWVAAGVTGGVDLWAHVPVPAPFLYAAGLSIVTAFFETIVDWLDRYGMPS